MLFEQVYKSDKRSDANLRKHLASSSHQIRHVLFASQLNHDSKVEIPIVLPERKRELHTAAVNCILTDGLPFGVFRQPGMSRGSILTLALT